MSNRKTTAEKLEEAKLEKQQAEARIKKLEREQKAADRKERDRRLYKRGGLIESLLPDVIPLSDEQFHSFMHMTVANKFGKDKLAQIIADDEKAKASPKPAQAETATQTQKTEKPSGTGGKPPIPQVTQAESGA